MKHHISVVIPTFNEEHNIRQLYERVIKALKHHDYELIFINDGSTDRTGEIIRELIQKDHKVRLLDFSRNFGHEAATTAGVEHSRGDATVIIDADLQDPPELIEDMIKLWEQGYEVVYATRRFRKNETFLKKLTAKLFYKIINLLADIKIPENTGDFRLIDKKVVEDFRRLPEKNRFFRGLISWIGYRQIGIEFVREKRNAGRSKYNYFKLTKLAFDSLTGFTSKPLSFITFTGFALSILSFILIILFILNKVIYQFPVPGWTSLAIIILFFNGFQITLIGIIAEYIARMFIETKNRPLYLIKEVVANKNTHGPENI